jgi:hypothetical protein
MAMYAPEQVLGQHEPAAEDDAVEPVLNASGAQSRACAKPAPLQ